MAEEALRWMNSLEKYAQKRRPECWCTLLVGGWSEEEEEPQKISDKKSLESRKAREKGQRHQGGALDTQDGTFDTHFLFQQGSMYQMHC